MVLDRKDGQGFMSQPGNRVVVKVDVSDLDIRRQRSAIDGKAVIVRGDLDLSSVEIFYRLVAAAVAEFQFIC